MMKMAKIFSFGLLAVTVMTGNGLSVYGFPSVFPTGTTIFNPEKTWSGYTVFDAPDGHGTILIDMNGNVLRQWQEVSSVPGPFRILPGGFVMGGDSPRPPHQEAIALIQLNWDGEEVWRFDRMEEVQLQDSEDENGETIPGELVWSSRQHHDWQREGNPVGYYAPGLEPLSDNGKTLVLAHKNLVVPEISPKRLEDDYLYELSWEGEVLWDWLASDHIEEFGFSEDALNAIHRSVEFNQARDSADWLHINSATYLGPNQWYDEGDERFHPDNIMISSRTASFIAIINRDGNVVWRLGPDYTQTREQAEIGQIIGQHFPHLIPQGLPGAGNLLVFDNGGRGGYGFSNPANPDGILSMTRDYSRVLEINPVTLEIVWQYSISPGTQQFQFYSWYVSNAQRLPNGNTMINEGMDGRIFELTPENEIVWEYVSPFFGTNGVPSNRIFRAHRVPYDWIPQLQQPDHSEVVPPDNSTFRVPAN